MNKHPMTEVYEKWAEKNKKWLDKHGIKRYNKKPEEENVKENG
jgi:hypothetical protein